jgi:hypothetical protein
VLRALKIAAAALVIGLTGGPTVVAQSDALQFLLDQAKQRRLQQQQQNGRRVVTPRPTPRDTWRRPSAPATVIVRDTPERPKVDPHTFILVLGDSFADQLAGGLDEAFADQPEIAIVRRTRAESGLARADYYDWPKSVRDVLGSDQKISFAVIQLGANDRQPIRDEGGQTHEPGSDRWRELYGQRVEIVARSFAERRIPVVWAGMPPMQLPRYSADILALNDLQRAAAQKAGAQFVDIWEAFVDAENKFSFYGPDLNGQTTRLRTNDGVHFTKAGARKAAHFVELELRRLIEMRPASTVVAVPGEPSPIQQLPLELQPGGVERAIDRMVSGLPEPAGLPSLPMKPAAGPIISLNRPAISPNGALASGRDPRPANDAQALIDRVYGEGRLPEAKLGRVDDFRWPR